MKSNKNSPGYVLNPELSKRAADAGIHEDAFFVGGRCSCTFTDTVTATSACQSVQAQVLAEEGRGRTMGTRSRVMTLILRDEGDSTKPWS
jgi:hypothetical protein